MQTVTLETLRSDLQKLQREAIAVHSRAAGGDKAAATRRAELMTAIQFTLVQIAALEVDEQEDRKNKQLESARKKSAMAQQVSAKISEVLATRTQHASNAEVLLLTLGTTLKQLIHLHRIAGDAVRRAMPIDEAISLDTDDLGVVRAALSTLFAVAGIDPDDAVRSLEGLRFGTTVNSVEAVQTAVEQQNVFLISIRDRLDRRLADHVAELEAEQPEESQPEAA